MKTQEKMKNNRWNYMEILQKRLKTTKSCLL